MKIEYQEWETRTLIAYFVDGYKTKPSSYEWFYDPAKEKIIIKLYLKEKEDE